MIDRSNGYEAIAAHFNKRRGPGGIGARHVLHWARTHLPNGGAVLDLGCGGGAMSHALAEDGFAIYGVDASESMLIAFRERIPGAQTECSAVEDAAFFGRKFDGVMAWGLFFLLPAADQRSLIAKVARALEPGGHFLFTAPRQECTWLDAMTDLPSYGLGYDAYREALNAAGLTLTGEDEDEGGNFYYLTTKT